MADTVNEAIDEAAKAGVSRITTDGTTVEAMPIGDQIAADKYLKAREAREKNHLGLAFRQFKPGGCG